MIRSVRSFTILACLSLLLAAPARAEPTATQKATAETLFQRGVQLAESGRLAEACSQFEGSWQIDPALGTLLRLADCHDRVGRTASAWALFSEAQARARAAKQPARERMAAERVSDLERRLSKVTLSLGESSALPGIELRMNDVLVPSASWGLPLPLDPGPQRLRLSAPGYRDWEGAITVEAGPSSQELTLPPLAPIPMEKPAPPPPAPRLQASPPKVKVESSPPYPSWLGYFVGGAGLVSAGVAGMFGYRAYDLNQRSLDECSSVNANACTQRGDALRDDARRAGVTSTVFAVTGGALLAGGITLVLLRPSRQDARNSTVRLMTSGSPTAAFANVAGSF